MSTVDFDPRSGSHVLIDGEPYTLQNGNEPWSVRQSGDTLRFEIRPGDQWDGDTASRERTEICGDTIYAQHKDITIDYQFMLEKGDALSDDSWLTIGQLHSADNFSAPPVSMELIGEKLAISIWYRLPGENYKNVYAFVDDANIVRDHYYDVKFDVHTIDDGKGTVDVWLDGERIVDYSGPVGFGYGVYWKEGLYRNDADETIAMDYRGLSITGEVGSRIDGTWQADRITPTHLLAGEDRQSDEGDQIHGWGGRDRIKGAGGEDLIFGDDGADRIQGGREDDTLLGGVGNDRLRGGPGEDVFSFDLQSDRDIILDFKVGEDRILFQEAGLGKIEDLHMRSVGHDVLLSYHATEVVVVDVRIADLDEGQFLFA